MFWIIASLIAIVLAAFMLRPLLGAEAPKNRWLAIGLGVAIPATAVTVYLLAGTPAAVQANPVTSPAPVSPPISSAPASEVSATILPSVAEMATRLHQRLQQNPNDANGWLLLASSWDHLGDATAAQAARERAAKVKDGAIISLPEPQLPGASVSGVVKLAAVLADRVNDADTVFIFARAATGPRMPFAVRRYQGRDFPITFTLDDSHAISPIRQLSGANKIVIGVRVSRTGNAAAQNGDLQGLSAVLDVHNTAPVTITIDDVVDATTRAGNS